MLKRPELTKKTGGAITALIMTAVGFTQFPFLGNAVVKDPTRSASDVNRTSDRAKLDEALKVRSNVTAVARRLNVSAEELHEFLNNQVKDRESIKTLLTEVVAPERGKSADELVKKAQLEEILGSYIKLRRSGLADSFHISEIDLVEINNTWTPTQKTNFERVLRRAAEIAKTSRAATLEEAFEISLKENGFLEAYRRGCRTG